MYKSPLSTPVIYGPHIPFENMGVFGDGTEVLDGLSKEVEGLNAALEVVQKALNALYLVWKRVFPPHGGFGNPLAVHTCNVWMLLIHQQKWMSQRVKTSQ